MKGGEGYAYSRGINWDLLGRLFKTPRDRKAQGVPMPQWGSKCRSLHRANVKRSRPIQIAGSREQAKTGGAVDLQISEQNVWSAARLQVRSSVRTGLHKCI